MSTPGTLYAWRHPPARAAQGRCIGHTDLPVDPRKAKRLAHRLRAQARRLGLPRVVCTSPLARGREVGRWLARWGWQHRVDAALSELHFGAWEGRTWAAVPAAEVEAWCQHFLTQGPGGHGEPVPALLARVQGFEPGLCRLLVTHGGWLSAALWLQHQGAAPPEAARWPAAPAHARCTRLDWPLQP